MNVALSLHIAPPLPLLPDGRGSHAEERFHWLGRVEEILQRVVGVEAHLWLCSALAALSVPRNVQVALFVKLLRRSTPSSTSSQSKRQGISDENQVIKQVVRMLCDKRRRQVARLLAHDYMMLCRFFSGQSKRVLQWFEKFAVVGETEHQLGSRALARYAFVHREACWHELVWKGHRSQAPATVASKPYYFSELDVLKTINNFLDNVPSFWSSEELLDSLQDGEFLALDIDFFIEDLMARMAGDNSAGVWQLVETYVAEESFAVLCKCILPIVSDNILLEFLNRLGADIAKWNRNMVDQKREGEGNDCSMENILWLELVMSMGVQWETLNDAMFCNACASHGRELSRLLRDENRQEEGRVLHSLLLERNVFAEKEHWELRQECLILRKWEAVKWLSLEAWSLFYLLSEESTLTESLECLMTENGIGFLCTSTLSVGETKLESQDKEMRAAKEKKSRKRQRRKMKGRARKRHGYSKDDNSESDSGLSTAAEDFQRQTPVMWRLSLDNYVTTWTKVDLVEHLVSHALTCWLHWIIVRG